MKEPGGDGDKFYLWCTYQGGRAKAHTDVTVYPAEQDARDAIIRIIKCEPDASVLIIRGKEICRAFPR